MATRAPRPCTSPGCSQLSRDGSGRCPDHPRKAWTNKRKPSGRGGSKWRAKRELVFQRDNFLCQAHLKRGEWVEVTLHGPNHGICDHIIPVAEGGTDHPDNLQTLCQACSNAKTAAEAQRGRGG